MRKFYKNLMMSVFAIVAICVMGFAFTACKSEDDPNTETPPVTTPDTTTPTTTPVEPEPVAPLVVTAKAKQVGDEQRVRVYWESNEMLDEVYITLKHGNEIEKTMVIDDFGFTLNEELRGEEENSVVIETFYGRHTVEVVAKAGDRVSEKQTKTVDVYTDEYNIAPLVATVPVSVYTLGMKNYTNNYEISTFFWLERSNQWDYTKLPDNVYPIPTATKAEITSEYNTARDPKTVAWVKELYEINNDSKFNFYCNDYWPTVWLDAVYGNEIPVENFKITLLSDGTASYMMFNNVYNNADAAETYAEYEALWEDYKEGAVTSLTTEQCRALVYVWVQDEDIDLTWVINRIDTIGQANDDVKNRITELYASNTGRIRRYYLDQLWNALSDDEKADLKALYHIGDVFAVAEEEEKIPMVILGTSDSGEGNDLGTYLSLVMEYYGDDYIYYYKGHPMYPTNANPTKQALLEELGIYELESSIPAEFFYYFYPTVAYSGYGSSTFTNVGGDPSKAVFTRFETCDANYKDHLEIFISKLSDTDETYGDLVESGDTDKFLIQDKANLDEGVFTTIKIYDATEKTFTTYNWVEDEYVVA